MRAAPATGRAAILPAGTWFALLLLVLAGCESHGEYFGRVRKPTAKRLIFENGAEPVSLDPQLMGTTGDADIADALYSSLVRLHPITMEPTADIATHFERNPESTRYVFYMRGNPHPRGTRLQNTDDLREQFRSGRISQDLARGHKAPPDSTPARWSDGRPVTAHDFVYSWQRLFNPKTAAVYAQSYAYVLHSAEILAGTRKPEELGVRALDDWTLEVELASPTSFFLELLDSFPFYAVPRQAIEAAEARGAPQSWTEPQYIVTSGPFRLAEWRPYEKITVRKNPDYWEAGVVGLDEIVFLPIEDVLTNLNLYKAGEADVLLGLPPAFMPATQGMRDYRTVQLQVVDFVQCNTHQPPLDNPLVRYALNMATDKRQVARLYSGNQTPARSLVVPTGGYEPPAAVPVTIGGRTYDVSAYDPLGARELLAASGFPGGLRKDGRPMRLDLIYTTTTAVAGDVVELLRRQWRETLGIELATTKLESAAFFGAASSGQYRGLALNGTAAYPPVLFMDLFFSSPQDGGMFWQPAAFKTLVDETKATAGHDAQLEKLAHCDRMVLEGMPLIPLDFSWGESMFKPYVKNLPLNPIYEFRFKYAWVETG